MSGKRKPKRRSGCPLSASLEIFGDRWSLLIVRDLMVRGYRTFKEFQGSGEGIASNILADRLQKLEAEGILTAEAETKDARRVNYRLTQKGIDLAPALVELVLWGTKYEQTSAPQQLLDAMRNNREGLIAEVHKRWRERDSTPLIPKPKSPAVAEARAGKARRGKATAARRPAVAEATAARRNDE